jgi:hypothetical protein
MRYPSEASYLDTITITITKLKNARINVAIGKKSDPISNEALSENIYRFSPNS